MDMGASVVTGKLPPISDRRNRICPESPAPFCLRYSAGLFWSSGTLEASMARAFWKGSISFGLVNIPVALHTAEKTEELSFHQLDKRDLSPVRYKRINEKSEQEVPWEQIVRG